MLIVVTERMILIVYHVGKRVKSTLYSTTKPPRETFMEWRKHHKVQSHDMLKRSFFIAFGAFSYFSHPSAWYLPFSSSFNCEFLTVVNVTPRILFYLNFLSVYSSSSILVCYGVKMQIVVKVFSKCQRTFSSKSLA